MLGDRRQVLDSDIQHLENEKKVLSEKLQKLEETARRIANEAVLQHLAQHHHVTQISDPKSPHLPQEKKAEIPPDFNFFVPVSNKEHEQNEKSVFDRLIKVLQDSDSKVARDDDSILMKVIQDNDSKKERDNDSILEWQKAFDLISNRLENDIVKIERAVPISKYLKKRSMPV